MKYDFVAIGDVTTDCFIKLKEAEELTNHGVLELCMPFGTKLPFESATEVVAVGNAANAAVGVARVGLKSALVAHVGGDQNGKNCLAALTERGVSTEYVAIHNEMRTNYHYVLQHGAERTILIKHEAYPYALPAFSEPPLWLYVTSLPEGTLEYQKAIAKYAKDNNVKLAFQPGTYQLEMTDELKDMYAVSEIFFCNKEEAQGILKTEEGDIKKLMEGIKTMGPKIVVVTDGRNGSNILESDGSAWHLPMYPDPAPPVSRTGAGDATACTTVAYLIKGLAPRDALARGLINSAAGVQAIHVQLGTLTDADVEDWYAKRPVDFIATQL